MNTEHLNWETTHTTEKMEHDFGNGYKIIVDKELNVAFKMKGFVVKDSFSTVDMDIDTYTKILINFAKACQEKPNLISINS